MPEEPMPHRSGRGGSRHMAMGALAAIVGLFVLAWIVGLSIVYGGLYNVAATEEHASFTRWTFDTTFRNSVENRAEDILAPEAVTPALVARGAETYKSSCQLCHGGPGVDPEEWASGMRPRPPHLAEAAAEWEIEEIYWLASNGVKMSGMPAFGPSHDEETLWGVAAFVKGLPGLTPEDYAQSATEPDAVPSGVPGAGSARE